ncbi:unnamed protein product [Cuscuta europaea]|uniref:cellulase n=1 Tax=Cuscuta europaea TaxID=41803 RepID=A0A9P0YMY7_CUSEU|nr:unnamed protein product [Cuscuta europaea]
MSMSYLVRYGPRFPQRVHHRAASTDTKSAAFLSQLAEPAEQQCRTSYATWYRNPDPNPHILTGALVGSPGEDDQYADLRSNYEQSEATMTGTAVFFRLLASLTSSSSQSPAAIQFMHSIVSKWSVGASQFCKHRVVIKNASHNMAVTDLKLRIDHLSPETTLWGLSRLQAAVVDGGDHDQDQAVLNTTAAEYALPHWATSIHPNSRHVVFYVQDCRQAKITLLSYRQL